MVTGNSVAYFMRRVVNGKVYSYSVHLGQEEMIQGRDYVASRLHEARRHFNEMIAEHEAHRAA